MVIHCQANSHHEGMDQNNHSQTLVLLTDLENDPYCD